MLFSWHHPVLLQLLLLMLCWHYTRSVGGKDAWEDTRKHLHVFYLSIKRRAVKRQLCKINSCYTFIIKGYKWWTNKSESCAEDCEFSFMSCSILGMHIFGCKFSLKTDTGDTVPDRKNFDSLLWAIVTVFQVINIFVFFHAENQLKSLYKQRLQPSFLDMQMTNAN